MYQLDAVGRLAPSSLDVSRAAARRSEHLAALESAGRLSLRAQPWLSAAGVRLGGSSTRTVVPPVRTARPTQGR